MGDRRKLAHEILDDILDGFENNRWENKTPKFDRVSEAQRCTRLFWHLYNECLTWAEDIQFGKYVYENDDHVREVMARFSTHRPEDYDWFYEIIAPGRRKTLSSEMGLKDIEILDGLYDYLWDAEVSWFATRHVAFEMTHSPYMQSGWRADLQNALEHLINDMPAPLFQVATNNHGNPVKQFDARMSVVLQSLFLCGTGMTKTNSRRELGTRIGLSEHTIKKWEAALRKIPVNAEKLNDARLAGSLDQEIQKAISEELNELKRHPPPADHPIQNISTLARFRALRRVENALADDDELLEVVYGVTRISRAWHEHAILNETTPEDLRRLVRDARHRADTKSSNL